MPVLEIQDVHKSYRRTSVLRGASLNVNEGELVGLVGENGSGKSTLLRIVVGLLGADGGSVQLNGEVGYCPQEPVLFDALTMRENLTYFGAGHGLRATEIEERSEALFHTLRCAEDISKRVGNLSGGTRQKLNLIVALLHRPALLVLDEPYQGFDYESYLAFWKLAGELKSEGRSVLVVSHMLVDRDPLDRVYSMQNGIAVEQD